MKLMDRLHKMETRPIHWVFQIKISRMPIPIELGFTRHGEALAAREEFEYSNKQNIIRWTDIKQLDDFQYVANRVERRTDVAVARLPLIINH